MHRIIRYITSRVWRLQVTRGLAVRLPKARMEYWGRGAVEAGGGAHGQPQGRTPAPTTQHHLGAAKENPLMKERASTQGRMWGPQGHPPRALPSASRTCRGVGGTGMSFILHHLPWELPGGREKPWVGVVGWKMVPNSPHPNR